MKRILLIDDMRKIACDNGEKITIARDFFTGIRLLQEGNWDELLLDHDLGPDSVKYGKEWTGYDVINWLERNPKLLPGKITCVSSNPVGREKIEKVAAKLYKDQKTLNTFEVINKLNDYFKGIIWENFEHLGESRQEEIIDAYETLKDTIRRVLG